MGICNYSANCFCYAFEGLIHDKNRCKSNEFDKEWTILSFIFAKKLLKKLSFADSLNSYGDI